MKYPEKFTKYALTAVSHTPGIVILNTYALMSPPASNLGHVKLFFGIRETRIV